MRLFFAIFLPWFSFFTTKRPLAGLLCLFLQLTMIGWIPAALWAIFSLSDYKTSQKIKKIKANNSRASDDGFLS